LRFLVDEIVRHPVSRSLTAGETITAGTLTEAMPAAPDESWTIEFSGIDLQPVRVHLRE
jgi:2-oxo-3-hexenedioate decarboxylase